MGVPQQKLFASMSHLNKILPEDRGDCDIENVADFYNNAKIFVTGATGFLGKALLEKLLRSCDKIDAIFLLMRPKKGVAVEQRLKDLLKNSVFNKIREKNSDVFEKVKVIPGDVGLSNLGLSDQDLAFLIDKVNVVFHSAATVKFNEKLKNAVILNTLGTKRLLEICIKMKNLKSFIHVSTAFSNAEKRTIEEQVYVPSFDAETIINLIENLPDELIEAISDKLVGKHPNTYTFTKALAEQLVLHYSAKIPTAIVRPSIITAAWKEPCPGWVDNISGITGILMECGRGTIRSIICDDRCRMELIPVDIVVSILIASAWHVAMVRPNTAEVYNCTSGQTSPITWKEFRKYTLKHSVRWPSKYVTWYPGFTYRVNRNIHSMCTFMYHNVPSFVLDIYLYFSGQKTMMLKLAKKFNQALKEGSFFSTNEWEFKDDSVVKLVECVKGAGDGECFEVDFTPENGFDWDDYIADFLKGIRQFVLKDDIASLDQAKSKLNRLFWFQKILQMVLLYVVYKVIGLYF
ncbi:putative fatty acyl-CoA reductase CG5065 [Sitophilus oryzae]|uniref:Fatty acyl-CoA reductase n=1 Tax=Sitophilus oryzae TaxID=7048 RepID=A0A6J2YNB2_SITOR|nr:putative fatty acyl-CoA reductase CG5065 [Sitophilus oryzae]